jgi:glutathione S-transferase
MKLYFAPGACSLGIHVIFEEIGKPYEMQAVNLRAGDHFKSAFLAINPKAKVPAVLLDHGEILTEWLGIWPPPTRRRSSRPPIRWRRRG